VIATKYPVAVDPSKIGQWPALSKSGGGYFFDEVLEYRVWLHPERGAEDPDGSGDDYYYAFAICEEALEFSRITPGAEEPLALVRQYEWVNEPQPGEYILEAGERITEWNVDWLSSGRRTSEEIRAFVARGLSPKPSLQRSPPG
jgi:hypothetical protein